MGFRAEFMNPGGFLFRMSGSQRMAGHHVPGCLQRFRAGRGPRPDPIPIRFAMPGSSRGSCHSAGRIFGMRVTCQARLYLSCEFHTNHPLRFPAEGAQEAPAHPSVQRRGNLHVILTGILAAGLSAGAEPGRGGYPMPSGNGSYTGWRHASCAALRLIPIMASTASRQGCRVSRRFPGSAWRRRRGVRFPRRSPLPAR